MPNTPNEQIRECLAHVEECAWKAAAQTNPTLKQDFLDMGWRWLELANVRRQQNSQPSNQPAGKVHTMGTVRPFAKSDTLSKAPPIEPLLLCPNCNVEMCLFGIEAESDVRDLYTFVCSACDVVEVRGVRVNKTPPVVIVGKFDT